MGKVYDALRRAEEQRAARIRETATSSAPAEPLQVPSSSAAPVARPVAPARPKRSWLRFWRRGREESGQDVGALNKRRIALLQPESFAAEQFRTLRSRLDSIAADRPLRTIAVTSAVPGEGKSMTSIGLAVVSAMHLSQRILLVECDMRQPAVARSLGLRLDAGLAEVLRGDAKPEDAILRVDGTSLDVLAVRGTPPNPSELLASSRMGELLEALAGRYDRIILDLPPVLGLPDAKTVGDRSDGLVFVVRAGHTDQEDVDSALEIVGRDHVLGVVLNAAEMETDRYSRYAG